MYRRRYCNSGRHSSLVIAVKTKRLSGIVHGIDQPNCAVIGPPAGATTVQMMVNGRRIARQPLRKDSKCRLSTLLVVREVSWELTLLDPGVREQIVHDLFTADIALNSQVVPTPGSSRNARSRPLG